MVIHMSSFQGSDAMKWKLKRTSQCEKCPWRVKGEQHATFEDTLP